MKNPKLFKRSLWFLGFLFIGMNIVAYFHAYKFTHFVDTNIVKTKDPKELPLGEKIKILFTKNYGKVSIIKQIYEKKVKSEKKLWN